MRAPVIALTLMAISLGGCVARQGGSTVRLEEMEGRHVYVGDGPPLRSSRAELLQAYRQVLQHHHDPELQREAQKRIADLEVEGSMAASGEDYSASIGRYLQVLNTNTGHPDNEHVLYNLARAFAQQGQPEKQFRVMEDLLTYYPQTAYRSELLFRRAEFLFTEGDNEEAIAHYEAIMAESQLDPFYEKSLYMKAWAELRRMNLQQAFDDFFVLIKRKLPPVVLRRGEPLERMSLTRGEREVVLDVLRGITMAVALSEEDMLQRLFTDEAIKPYTYLLYAEQVERYITQERYDDAAGAAEAFLLQTPRHPYAPQLQLRLMETIRMGGFKRRFQQAREEFVERYRVDGEHWRFLPEAQRKLLQPHLKEVNQALAANAHALAQRSGRAEDYDQAIHWYRRYLSAFPAEPESSRLNFMLAELLFSIGRYDEAAPTYERSAYHFPRDEFSAKAGYAALIAYSRHEETLKAGEFRDRWHWLGVSSGLNFVRRFADDPRAPRILANAAQELYELHLYQRAIDSVRLLLVRGVKPEQGVLLTALTVLGYSEFELGRYAEAERAYRQVLQMTKRGDRLYQQRQEWLAAAIYKQAERAREQGYPESAANHFLRVGQLASGSKIQVTADYDAAAALIAAGSWEKAIKQLRRFRRTYPRSPLLTDIGDKLAVAYMKAGYHREAALEFEHLAQRKGSDEAKRESLWLAAELYDKLQDSAARQRTYKSYVRRFPSPLEPAMEMRWKLAQLYQQQGDMGQRDKWYQALIQADAKGAAERTPRSRFLAAAARLQMAQTLFEEFDRIKLVEPLQQNLRDKKSVMEQALAHYSAVLDYQVAEATTNATYHIAELQRRFAQALLGSQRPSQLNADELEQYDMMLEEQAYPFEESAQEVHAANVARIPGGVFDRWVKSSLQALGELRPARYAKYEVGEEVFDGDE